MDWGNIIPGISSVLTAILAILGAIAILKQRLNEGKTVSAETNGIRADATKTRAEAIEIFQRIAASTGQENEELKRKLDWWETHGCTECQKKYEAEEKKIAG